MKNALYVLAAPLLLSGLFVYLAVTVAGQALWEIARGRTEKPPTVPQGV